MSLLPLHQNVIGETSVVTIVALAVILHKTTQCRRDRGARHWLRLHGESVGGNPTLHIILLCLNYNTLDPFVLLVAKDGNRASALQCGLYNVP